MRARAPSHLTPATQSGRRGSNPRHQAWKACALPAELLPHSLLTSPISHLPSATWWGKDSNLRRHKPADLQSAPVGHLGTPPNFVRAAGRLRMKESRRRDSNSRPPDYKSGALPTELRRRNRSPARAYKDNRRGAEGQSFLRSHRFSFHRVPAAVSSITTPFSSSAFRIPSAAPKSRRALASARAVS